MKTVNVAALKQNLSEYLHLVESGENVIVTSHRRAVARLMPEPGSESDIRSSTRPMRDLAAIHPIKLESKFSAEKTLLGDRER